MKFFLQAYEVFPAMSGHTEYIPFLTSQMLQYVCSISIQGRLLKNPKFLSGYVV